MESVSFRFQGHHIWRAEAFGVRHDKLTHQSTIFLKGMESPKCHDFSILSKQFWFVEPCLGNLFKTGLKILESSFDHLFWRIWHLTPEFLDGRQIKTPYLLILLWILLILAPLFAPRHSHCSGEICLPSEACTGGRRVGFSQQGTLRIQAEAAKKCGIKDLVRWRWPGYVFLILFDSIYWTDLAGWFAITNITERLF